jgi:hypothetical protein
VPSDPFRGPRVSSNWETIVKTKPEDQIHTDYWMFDRLSKGDGFIGKSGGDFIAGPIEYALNTSVQSYSDTDTFSTARVDVFDRYEYDWKEYIGTAVISQLEQDRNSGEGQIYELVAAKLDNLKNSERQKINLDMYGDGTANNSKALTGLGTLVSSTPTTGSPGGINRANTSVWRNQQSAGTQTASDFDNLRSTWRSLYNLCSNGMGGDHPQFITTTRTVFEGFEGLLIANERFSDANKTSGADGGFPNEKLKFKGSMVSYDNACPSGLAYLLNPMFLKLVYKTGAWMKQYDEIRPSNQTVSIFACRTMCNLIATQPRRLAVATSIT